jgi:hypothetical protein
MGGRGAGFRVKSNVENTGRRGWGGHPKVKPFPIKTSLYFR